MYAINNTTSPFPGRSRVGKINLYKSLSHFFFAYQDRVEKFFHHVSVSMVKAGDVCELRYFKLSLAHNALHQNTTKTKKFPPTINSTELSIVKHIKFYDKQKYFPFAIEQSLGEFDFIVIWYFPSFPQLFLLFFHQRNNSHYDSDRSSFSFPFFLSPNKLYLPRTYLIGCFLFDIFICFPRFLPRVKYYCVKKLFPNNKKFTMKSKA